MGRNSVVSVEPPIGVGPVDLEIGGAVGAALLGEFARAAPQRQRGGHRRLG